MLIKMPLEIRFVITLSFLNLTFNEHCLHEEEEEEEEGR